MQNTDQTTRIAVVGMSAWYPGAQTLRSFWENILSKRQQFREMVDCRLPLSDYFDADPKALDMTYGRNAAYIEEFEFDWQSKRIPKSAVESSDIVHWLTLDVALRALADAGYTKEQIKGSNTSVILGNTLTGEWTRANAMRNRWPFVRRAIATAAEAHGIPTSQLESLLSTTESAYKSVFPSVNEDTLAGALSNTVAGRVCNYLDLHGGGYTIDAACASSLLALINAANILSLKQTDMVFVGGVDVSLDTFELIGFAKTGALTPSEMRVYDERANGFVPGEGCGFAVLKRLEDALEAEDQIYAVINGWGVSSDGKGGITAPSIQGQARAIGSAYRMAGYDVSELDFVEGHGTGTPLGDRVEILALHEAMKVKPDSPRVGLTSLKSLLGHTKAAAGIGAFIKTVLAVNQRIVPPICGTEIPRDVFAKQASALYPLFDGKIHPKSDTLRAGVSAMGFGGINTHVTCESFGEPRWRHSPFLDEQSLLAHAEDTELFVFSAPSIARLLEKLDELEVEAANMSYAEVADLAADRAQRLQPGEPVRAAFLARTPTHVGQKIVALRELVKKGAREGKMIHDKQQDIWLGNSLQYQPIAFMFPGQGSQQVNMAKTLFKRFEWARQWLGDCEQIVAGLGTEHFSARFLVDNTPILSKQALAALQQDLSQTEVAQPALTLTSLLWYRYLCDAGIRPVAVGGHSLGELMALYAGGCYDEETLLRLASRRGHEMAIVDGDQPGKMAAIICTADEVRALIETTPGVVVLANMNAPKQMVVSGEGSAVDAVVLAAKQAGFSAKLLPVSNAFHSPLMEAAADRFGHEFSSLTGRVSSPLKVLSCIDGAALDGEIAVGQHLRRQILAPVDFVTLAQSLAEEAGLVIEVGSGRVLSDLFAYALPSSSTVALPVEPSIGSMAGLKRVLATAHLYGHDLNWNQVYASRLIRPFVPSQARKFIENPCERPMRVSDEILAGLQGQASMLAVGQVAEQNATASASPGAAHLMSADAPLMQATMHSQSASAEILAEVVTPEPAVVGTEGERSVSHRVLLVAARLTGYDPETLSPDMRLLDDLNMDSIKSAELLATLGREFRIDAETDLSSYANATLEEIVCFLGEQQGADPISTAGSDVEAIIREADSATTRRVSDVTAIAGLSDRQPAAIAKETVSRPASVPGLEKGLLQLIAEITQFDIETLSPDMRLLDDLNMDSIKAAEFLAVAAKDNVALQGLDLSLFANASISEIADALQVKPETGPPATATPMKRPRASAEFTKRETWVRDFGEHYRKLDGVEPSDDAVWAGRSVWILSDPDAAAIACACRSYLADQGAEVFEASFAAMDIPMGTPIDDALIIVPDCAQVNCDTLKYYIDSLQECTRALASRHGQSRLPRITYIQRYSRFPQRHRENPAYSANGYASSLALEQPALSVKIINLAREHKNPESLGLLIGREILVKRSQPIVALDEDGQFWAPEYSVLEQSRYQEAPIAWTEDDVVLVTGGARGITAECALAFGSQTGVKLALVGSSPLVEGEEPDEKTREIREVLARHHAAGVEARYFSADIADATAVAALVEAIQTQMGCITGLIHGAGVNRPRPVVTVSPAAAYEESAPKVMGLSNVLNELAPESLKLLVGFGSVIGVTGMQGNAWYAFANETLANLVAAYAQAHPATRAVTIAYSVWDEVGMGARLGSIATLGKNGIGAISVAEGVKRFLRLVSADAGTDQVIVAGRMGRFPIWNHADTVAVSASSQSYVERVLYHQPGVESIVRRRLSLTKDAYLRDHNFKGSYLFPTVFGLEAMSQVVRLVTGVDQLESVSIIDISLERPITVSNDYDTDIEVYAEVVEQDETERPVTVKAGVRSSLTGLVHDHFSATFILQGQREAPVVDLALPDDEIDMPIQGRLYGDILFQGPLFQRIEGIHQLENPEPGRGLCSFRSRHVSCEYLLDDPYFRDSLLQSVQIIIPNDLSLPVSIDRLDIYAESRSHTGERVCVAYLDRREGDYYFARVLALGPNGCVLEELTGYRLKILETRGNTEAIQTLLSAA
jgi:enediyne polyketide synthase